jgi:hypothetical protein
MKPIECYECHNCKKLVKAKLDEYIELEQLSVTWHKRTSPHYRPAEFTSRPVHNTDCQIGEELIFCSVACLTNHIAKPLTEE